MKKLLITLSLLFALAIPTMTMQSCKAPSPELTAKLDSQARAIIELGKALVLTERKIEKLIEDYKSGNVKPEDFSKLLEELKSEYSEGKKAYEEGKELYNLALAEVKSESGIDWEALLGILVQLGLSVGGAAGLIRLQRGAPDKEGKTLLALERSANKLKTKANEIS